MLKIDRVYIITLNHTPENYSSLVERLNLLGVPPGTSYQIIEGVNGRELFKTIEGREAHGIKFYEDWAVGGNEWWSRPVTVGEAGGICSHIQVWEDANRNGFDNVLIIEDDFNPIETIDWNVFNELDGYDYDIVFLSRLMVNHTGVHDSNVGLNNFVKPGYSYQTHCYVMSKSGLKKIVETNLETLKQNIIVSDEFLPATYTWHPRQDLRAMYNQNMNALALKWNPVSQLRHEAAGNSETAPIEGIDF
jgi:glycosyl transferase family 25